MTRVGSADQDGKALGSLLLIVNTTTAVICSHDCNSLHVDRSRRVLLHVCTCLTQADAERVSQMPERTGSASLALPMAPASHNTVYGLYPAGGDVRQAYAHLIQSGTCQRRTMCSWPQLPDPPQSGTCQAYTMCSCPRRSDLPHADVILAHTT
jgi:hypothetical protein